MMGYVILAAIILFAFSCLFSFIAGWKRGKKQAEAEYAEEQRRKEQDKKDYDKVKEEIKQETFGNAEQQKANLAGGSSGRERFDNINNSLRNNPKR
jgi:flagellar biosynthesis/type III secretory pathway M-ring protein FliF/YscJ